MKRGRKPKPTTLKLLQNTRADRINHSEPAAPAGVPDMPTGLSAAAKTEWKRLTGLLAQMGLLSKAEGPALVVYIDAFETWTAAKAHVKKHGITIKTFDGSMKTNPAMRTRQESRAQMVRLLTEFGLTPSSRSRVNAPGKAEKDEFEAFLAQA